RLGPIHPGCRSSAHRGGVVLVGFQNGSAAEEKSSSRDGCKTSQALAKGPAQGRASKADSSGPGWARRGGLIKVTSTWDQIAASRLPVRRVSAANEPPAMRANRIQ